MADCGCGNTRTDTRTQRQALRLALALNAIMFLVEVGAGVHARSTGLIADGLDMLTDATVYAVALAAITRSADFKARAAFWSGTLLLLTGLGVVLEAVRRAFTGGAPEGLWMIAVATLALGVNAFVLRLLARQRSREVHMRAAWIFTRADVVANAAVIASGLAVLASGWIGFDLVVGVGIGLYVMREAFEILREARKAGSTGGGGS
ncbi:cation diffusion facilitator family transporter [Novosphingobium sp. 1949]|uniref:Cation diffusion facilitator family transporter n=1 Tax=Novosphingobium organovorum TaxID=2930092 RepID=A0ABT0B9T0_9SPHN|nr:cation diffusion facilitator family transporter [Novosphingobium organovorum]MCJ2181811.1 cation diffusion facilitator family transporter [Novosphingobium organovorum]